MIQFRFPTGFLQMAASPDYLDVMPDIKFNYINRSNCGCPYCIDYNQEYARINAEYNASDYDDDFSDYLNSGFKWETIIEYIEHLYGDQYIPELNAKINAYIHALINDTPPQIEKSKYFADYTALGCHVRGYIERCFQYSRRLIGPGIVQGHLGKDRILRIAADFKWDTDNSDVFYECISTGNIPYLLEYIKDFKIDFTNIGLNHQIAKNPDLLTPEIITLLIDLAGREIIDYIMIKGLTDTIERIMTDNKLNIFNFEKFLERMPLQLEKLNCSLNILTNLDNLPAKLDRLSTTQLYMYHDTTQMNSEVESVLKMLNDNAAFKVYTRYCRNFIGSPDNFAGLMDKFDEHSREKNNSDHHSLEDIKKYIPQMFQLIIQDIYTD